MTTTAAVRLWGSRIGAVSLQDEDDIATFEYEPAFAGSSIEVSPITMPLAAGRRYRFPGLNFESFHGLPGLLADSLPDRYGEALINAWLATRGRSPDSFNAVERLCYIGKRGMGALEFSPARGPRASTSEELDLEALVALASEVMQARADLAVSLRKSSRRKVLMEILRVGTSAGGARAKALIALNPDTNEVRSGQLDAPPGFEHWILKFDGVEDDTRDFGSARGYGVTEWVYAQMATRAGIEMTECRLLEENDRRHFMTRRFDRLNDGSKLHLQSLAGLSHLDYLQPGANSYEQAFHAMRQLGLSKQASEELFRRMVFNVVARNQDDHVKNIAFLMNRIGEWSLSPAFDLAWAYNPSGRGTSQHQMSINGKRDNFTVEDLKQIAATAAMKRGRAEEILGEVTDAVREWPALATEAGVPASRISQISEAHRLNLPSI